jgi:hypothetical protein
VSSISHIEHCVVALILSVVAEVRGVNRRATTPHFPVSEWSPALHNFNDKHAATAKTAKNCITKLKTSGLVTTADCYIMYTRFCSFYNYHDKKYATITGDNSLAKPTCGRQNTRHGFTLLNTETMLNTDATTECSMCEML